MQSLDERRKLELLNRLQTWMIRPIMDGITSLEKGAAPGVGKDEEVCCFSVTPPNQADICAHI
jgi:hypothetical protein